MKIAVLAVVDDTVIITASKEQCSINKQQITTLLYAHSTTVVFPIRQTIQYPVILASLMNRPLSIMGGVYAVQ